MTYTISFALILYVVSAILDTYIGLTSINPYRLYSSRIAAIVIIIAIFILITKKYQIMKLFPLFLTSLILSIIIIAIGAYSDLIIVNTCVKAVAVLLTVKPDLIEVEIVSEDEKEQNLKNSNAKIEEQGDWSSR